MVLISPSREADFLLDGVVFLIGLDGHGLLAELREPALVQRDVLLDGAAGVLVFGEPFLGGGDALARGVEPRFERLLAFGLVGEPSLGVVRRRDEFLKRDEAFEVSVHRVASFNKKGPVETGPSADRCNRLLRCVQSGICNHQVCSLWLAIRSFGEPSRRLPPGSAPEARAKVGPPGFEPGTRRL